jgi:lactate dehydrogenase-like 2-hydroxyacid dehydrogenase
MNIKVLNYFEERIPINLRKLTINKFKNKKIQFKTIKYTDSLKKQISLIKWADVLFLTPGRFIQDIVLKNGQHLKLIQIWSSGYDKLNLKSIFSEKIPLANNGSVNSTSVAEHTVLLILSLFRKLLHFNRITKEGNWSGNSHGLDCFNLNKKKIGIIGFGKIGKKVANICSSFGAKIYYYDIQKLKKTKKKDQPKYLSLNKLISSCDIISLHLHHDQNTNKILNKERLKKMKKNSILINVSRAGLVDNKYLHSMLTKNKILGAGLDVYDKEPTKKGDLFLNLDNTVLTPHTAGSTIDTYEEVLENCYKNIINVLNNRKINWLIKKNKRK